MFPAQDVRVGGRQGRSQYQFTLWSSDLDELLNWVPRAVERMQDRARLVDVSTDREQGGFQLNVSIDRQAAARLGVRIQDIDARAQQCLRAAAGLDHLHRSATSIASSWRSIRSTSAIRTTCRASTSAAAAARRSRSSTVARFERGIAPLVVNHQGQFPAVTISFGLAPGVALETATAAVQQAVLDMRMPDIIQAEFAGDAQGVRADRPARSRC